MIIFKFSQQTIEIKRVYKIYLINEHDSFNVINEFHD